MPEPVHVFWAIVAVLALAAAINHGWHHTGDDHLSARLARASYRGPRAATRLADQALEVEGSPGA